MKRFVHRSSLASVAGAIAAGALVFAACDMSDAEIGSDGQPLETASFAVSGFANLYQNTLFPTAGALPAVPVPGACIAEAGQIHVTATGCVIDDGPNCTGPDGYPDSFRGLPVYSLIGQWSTDPAVLDGATAVGGPFFVGSDAVVTAPAAPGDYYLFLADNDGIFSDNGGAYQVTAAWDEADACSSVWADICPESDPAGVDVPLYAVVDGVPADDEGVSAEMLLPFKPYLFGSQANRFRVFSNGFSMHRWIDFHSIEYTNEPHALPHVDPLQGMIAPLWADLAGVRVCMRQDADQLTLQWAGTAVATGAPVELQASISAPTGVVRFVYGPGHDAGASEHASVGLEGGASAHGVNVSFEAAGATEPLTGYELTPNHPQWSTAYSVSAF